MLDPADNRRVVGEVVEADPSAVEAALERAVATVPAWETTSADERAAILERAADLFEANIATLMAMAVREAGKTIPDAVAEVREAVDFCRYYAVGARAEFAAPQKLPGPTGEVNEVALRGRGVFVCISPWNFPLAIFTGPGGGGPSGRQRGHRQARRADPADRRSGGAAVATRRACRWMR